MRTASTDKTDAITAVKKDMLLSKKGAVLTGYVVSFASGSRALLERGKVRWFNNEQFQGLRADPTNMWDAVIAVGPWVAFLGALCYLFS